MDEFLRQVRDELGLSEKVALQGVAVVIRHLSFGADRRDLRAIFDAVDGLARVAVAAERHGHEGRRGIAVQPVDAAADLTANLSEAGLPADRHGPFVEGFVDFVRAHGPAAIVDRRVEATPAVRALVAAAGR